MGIIFILPSPFSPDLELEVIDGPVINKTMLLNLQRNICLMAGLSQLNGLLQPKWFYDSMTYF